jgi:hypothetical protein
MIGAAVMIGAPADELEDEPPAADEAPEAADEAPEAADEPAALALEPALLAAPLREEAALDKLEAAPEPAAPTAVKRVVEPIVEVVTALLPDEMVVTTAPIKR